MREGGIVGHYYYVNIQCLMGGCTLGVSSFYFLFFIFIIQLISFTASLPIESGLYPEKESVPKSSSHIWNAGQTSDFTFEILLSPFYVSHHTQGSPLIA